MGEEREDDKIRRGVDEIVLSENNFMIQKTIKIYYLYQ
jgi:hypothetical protein